MGGGKRDEAEEKKNHLWNCLNSKTWPGPGIFARSSQWLNALSDEYQVDFIDVPAAEDDKGGCDADADDDSGADTDGGDDDDGDAAADDDDGDDPPDESPRGLIALPRGHTSTAVAMHLARGFRENPCKVPT